MVWRHGGEGATHKGRPGSTQWFQRNLSLRMTDGRLRHNSTSNSADKSNRAKKHSEQCHVKMGLFLSKIQVNVSHSI